MQKQNRQILLIERLLEVTSKFRLSTELGNMAPANAAELSPLPVYTYLGENQNTSDSLVSRDKPGKGTS